MQENSFICYGKIKQLKVPTPAGVNSRNEPVYNVVATMSTLCGSAYTDGQVSSEIRDIEIVFNNASQKQIDLLSVNAEVMINGASVITTDMPQSYPRERLHTIATAGDFNRESLIDFISECVYNTTNGNIQQIRDQISLLIPATRKKTIVRVKSGQWTLKASERQIVNATQIDQSFDVE